MKANPIIPIWLMTIICIILVIVLIYDKQKKLKKYSDKKSNTKKYNINTTIEIIIISLLFMINLRIMISNGEINIVESDLGILFVVDTSVSMKALDYDGQKERLEGVINDCCYIVDELSGCKFSIITFGDTVQKLIPFTTDSDMVQAELKTIKLENDFYAKGTSINSIKSELEKTLNKEKERNDNNSKIAIFFITDGEITKENEKLESFSNLKQYVSDGAVLGYGTTNGGKMIYSLYEDNKNGVDQYLYYYDDNYNKITAVSKIDENNLKKLSTDIGIDYIKMSKQENINYKINEIKKKINESEANEDKIESYKDTYFFIAIPLVILFIIKFSFMQGRI